MNIALLTREPIPKGLAHSNRILSYSKGLVELGHYVKFFCLVPTEHDSDTPVNKDIKGTFNGIDFEYTPGTTSWPRGKKLLKIYILCKSYTNALLLLHRMHKEKHIDAMVMPRLNFLGMTIFFIFSRLVCIKYLQERTEHPMAVANLSFLGRLDMFFYKHLVCKYFDGMYLMTKGIHDFFEPRVRKGAKLIIVPMTVESERFSGCTDKPEETSPYIAYCGDMSNEKDGVYILVDAFRIVAEKHPDLKLYLIGQGLPAAMEKIMQMAKDYRLSERIVMTGRVSRDEMPKYLCNATILALARPQSLQAAGGFPMKLGEYLSTGRPVVVTKVGQIPEYLEDDVNAFLSEPDSAQAFAHRLEDALSDPERSRQIGLKGRELPHNVFSYKKQAQRIAEFMATL